MSRRAWHQSTARCPAFLDTMEDPSEWVLAYLMKREEPPSWWPEFWSLHHKGFRHLSDSQVQALAKKQAVSCKLPAALKEIVSCWNALPSLSSLGHADFLSSSPTKVQGSWNIQVVRRDQIVGLVKALQWCAEWLGLPLAYSVGL